MNGYQTHKRVEVLEQKLAEMTGSRNEAEARIIVLEIALAKQVRRVKELTDNN